MKKDLQWLTFLLKKVKLFALGLIHFGPIQTYRAQRTLSRTLDAFEEHYGRLPDQDEQRLLARKLAWFNEHHNRLPTHQEAREIAEQVNVR